MIAAARWPARSDPANNCPATRAGSAVPCCASSPPASRSLSPLRPFGPSLVSPLEEYVAFVLAQGDTQVPKIVVIQLAEENGKLLRVQPERLEHICHLSQADLIELARMHRVFPSLDDALQIFNGYG